MPESLIDFEILVEFGSDLMVVPEFQADWKVLAESVVVLRAYFGLEPVLTALVKDKPVVLVGFAFGKGAFAVFQLETLMGSALVEMSEKKECSRRARVADVTEAELGVSVGLGG